jgi:glucose/arabinose dehydrogenase
LIVLSTVVSAALLVTGTAAGTTLTPVMTGLDNPRGLAFAKNGELYVAEAGRGGTGPCQVLRGVTACYGPTGRISRYWQGQQKAVVTGLPSYVTATDATGPHDLTVHGQ